MKILIIGSGALGSLEGIYFRAMLALGESVDFFDVDPHISVPSWLKPTGRLANNRFTFRLWAAQANIALIRYLSDPVRQYDVIYIFKGMQFSAEVIREGRHLQKFAIWVNINPDDPFNKSSVASTNREVVKSIPLFDLYCIWSRRLLGPIQAAGCKQVIYLPFAYDPSLHSPPAHVEKVPRSESISFVGAWDKEREKVLTGLAHFELRVCGGAWGRVSKGSPLARRIVGGVNIFGVALAEEVFAAAASLNIMRSQNIGAHNMRTFEIPAMGGLLLTTRSEEQEEYFPEGRACLMFEGKEELKEKIEWIISNPDHAMKIRKNGRENVVHHTYQARALTVLNEIRTLRGERRAR